MILFTMNQTSSKPRKYNMGLTCKSKMANKEANREATFGGRFYAPRETDEGANELSEEESDAPTPSMIADAFQCTKDQRGKQRKGRMARVSRSETDWRGGIKDRDHRAPIQVHRDYLAAHNRTYSISFYCHFLRPMRLFAHERM